MRRAALAALLLAGCQAAPPAPVTTSQTASDRALLSRLSPLPPLPESPTNRFADDERAARLGHRLFFDPALSRDGRFSCASCHRPESAFADGLPVGVALGTGHRNTPSLLLSAHQRWQGWAGKADSVWHQAVNAMENPIEQGARRLAVAAHLRARYQADYVAIFGPLPEGLPPDGGPGDPAYDNLSAPERQAVDQATANVGKALEAYVRRLTPGPAPVDRFVAGDDQAMSEEARRGARLFLGKAGCASCHNGPLLSDGDFHNVGVPQSTPDNGRLGDLEALLTSPLNAEGPFSDHRTARPLAPYQPGPALVGRFKTPILRNVALTAPYWHAGASADLAHVVAFEAAGGGAAGSFPGAIDDGLLPVRLDAAEVGAIVAFLHALTGEPVPAPWGGRPE